MESAQQFEIFLMVQPGLEQAMLNEARDAGFTGARSTGGGVTFTGTWQDVWRANLHLRGATRVLARIGEFRAFHLAQLDKRARKFPWGEVLRPDVPIKVETVTNKKSKIYHAGAATQRVERALQESFGATITEDAPVTLKLRIDDNNCVFSVDTSGEPLHKRGHKVAVGKAPMRETMAALFLRECGFAGQEPVVDPMCGSGTFVIEAAEMAAGLAPGRSRSFAFEQLASFDAEAWAAMRAPSPPSSPALVFQGSDRNAGAVEMAAKNADRAGVSGNCQFIHAAVSDLEPPEGPPGSCDCEPAIWCTNWEQKAAVLIVRCDGRGFANPIQRLACRYRHKRNQPGKGHRSSIFADSSPDCARRLKGPPVPHRSAELVFRHGPDLARQSERC